MEEMRRETGWGEGRAGVQKRGGNGRKEKGEKEINYLLFLPESKDLPLLR